MRTEHSTQPLSQPEPLPITYYTEHFPLISNSAFKLPTSSFHTDLHLVDAWAGGRRRYTTAVRQHSQPLGAKFQSRFWHIFTSNHWKLTACCAAENEKFTLQKLTAQHWINFIVIHFIKSKSHDLPRRACKLPRALISQKFAQHKS